MLSVAADGMPPVGLMYLWLWAALEGQVGLPTLDFSYMRESVRTSTANAPVESVLSGRDTGEGENLRVVFDLDASQVSPIAMAPDTSATVDSVTVDDKRTELGTSRRVMLITLGPWVEQADSWDETPWGGGLCARSGYGFREGMSERQLIDAARVFWKFNPNTATWRDIEYAVVAHVGVTRAVIRIENYVGPLWGRYGFRGHLVDDPALVAELVGKSVPGRQNPITTWG